MKKPFCIGWPTSRARLISWRAVERRACSAHTRQHASPQPTHPHLLPGANGHTHYLTAPRCSLPSATRCVSRAGPSSTDSRPLTTVVVVTYLRPSSFHLALDIIGSSLHIMAVDSQDFAGLASASPAQFVPPSACALAYAAAPPPSPAPCGPPPPPWLCFSGPLVGCAVAVPETAWEPAGDPRRCLTGTIGLQASGPDRVLVHFADTGVKEWVPVAQVQLLQNQDVSPLCAIFAAL